MIALLAEISVVVAALSYVIRTFVFFWGVRKEQAKNARFVPVSNVQSSHSTPRISVIVPARNEELTISLCLDSLIASEFPQGKFEIIVVDDRSSDSTALILAEYLKRVENLRVITITEEFANSLTSAFPTLLGKPRALHAGIMSARGEIIAMTDADCVVSSQWLATIESVFEDEQTGLLAGFTVIDEPTLFPRLQASEWIATHTFAMAGVGLSQPLGCFGNNLSIRRQVYDSLGGYGKIVFSVTEDLALLQAVSQTKWTIRYVCSNALKVTTFPTPTMLDYIKQHQRWARGGMALGWRATIFVASSALLWIGIAANILNANFENVLLIYSVRLVSDWFVLSDSIDTLEMKQLKRWFPVAVLFFFIVELCIPFTLLQPSVRWKGQTFK